MDSSLSPSSSPPPPKKLKMSTTTSEDDNPAPNSPNSQPKKQRFKRRKIAIFLAYCGVGYQGMQKNPGAKTIESDLEEALFLSGAVPEPDRGNPKRFDWARSARTDKGVSAVGQVVSGRFYIDPPGLVDRLNSHLSPQIRIFGYKRVTGSFNAKKFCDRRRYVYLLPVFALDPNSHPDRESVLASVGSGNELTKCFECSERGRKVVGLMGRRRDHTEDSKLMNEEINGGSDASLDSTLLPSGIEKTENAVPCSDGPVTIPVSGTEKIENATVGENGSAAIPSSVTENTLVDNSGSVMRTEEMTENNLGLDLESQVHSEVGKTESIMAPTQNDDGSTPELMVPSEEGKTEETEGNGGPVKESSSLADEAEVGKAEEATEKTAGIAVDSIEEEAAERMEPLCDNRDETLPSKSMNFHYGDKEREWFNRILKHYVGTHNFHNFTTRIKAEDPSARRYIVSFTANDVVTVDGMEFIRCEVVGQSFMLHQIRKMIGVAVAVMRNCAPESLIEIGLKKDVNINVPTAPEVGLYLDECLFTSYNQKWKDSHEQLSMEAYAEQAEDFKMKHIHSHIANMEHKEGVVALWLHSLNHRNYPDFQFVEASQTRSDMECTQESNLGD